MHAKVLSHVTTHEVVIGSHACSADRPTIDARRALVVPTHRLNSGLATVIGRIVCKALLGSDVVVDGETRREHKAGVETLLFSDVIRDRQSVQDVEALHCTHEAAGHGNGSAGGFHGTSCGGGYAGIGRGCRRISCRTCKMNPSIRKILAVK